MRARTSLLSMILVVICSVASNAQAIGSEETDGSSATADVYPSREAAAIALTTQAIEALREGPDRPADNSTLSIVAVGNTDVVYRRLVTQRLQQAFDAVHVQEADAANNAPLTVELDATHASTVSLTIRGGQRVGAHVFAVTVVDKPWADNWSLFRNANASKRYLLATSTSPGVSEAEAIASAQKEAVEQLAPIMTETIRANAARYRGPKIPVTQAWIRERLLSTIKRNNDNVLVADSFVQKFARPYGDIYRASLLIDASQKKINDLAEGYNAYARNMASNESKAQRTTWGATGGILLIVLLLYAFLNTVTKGYFLWRLRAVALLIAIAGLLIVFANHG